MRPRRETCIKKIGVSASSVVKQAGAAEFFFERALTISHLVFLG
jgi:hypothetical protein